MHAKSHKLVTITHHDFGQAVCVNFSHLGWITHDMDDGTWMFEHRRASGPHMQSTTRDGLLYQILAYVHERRVYA